MSLSLEDSILPHVADVILLSPPVEILQGVVQVIIVPVKAPETLGGPHERRKHLSMHIETSSFSEVRGSSKEIFALRI
jgi:hypothetical protein